MAENNDDVDEPREVGKEIDSKQMIKKRKKVVPGVIYLSRIPPFMKVKEIRDNFGRYGEVGRVFLQPDEKAVNSIKGRLFTEGWVEFEDKNVAKKVALCLNNAKVGGKKRSQWHDELWNIKYLNRFKWAHLNERLAYEREVHKQRMRTEISQVKREAQFHIRNAEKEQTLKHMSERKMRQGKLEEAESLKTSNKTFEFTQRETEDNLLRKKRSLDTKSAHPNSKRKMKEYVNKKSIANRSQFLKNLFSGGNDDS